MNTQNRNIQIGAEDSFLDSVERAIAEKMRTGHADDLRYGFAARIANATPPVNETFQQALRARILAELTKKEKQTMATKDRVPTINSWRFALVGMAAAVVILILAFAMSQHIPVWEPEKEPAPIVALAPQLAARDVEALVDRLNEDPTPRTVVVFPGDYAATLAERIQHQVVPLLLNGDLNLAAIQAALGTVLPRSGLVDVVMVSQEATDAARQVRIALEQRLYRLYRPDGAAETETFGALERNSFVVGPEDVALEPIGAIFDGGVELVAGGVLDDPQPGAPLRLAFDWRVTEPVNDSLVMFVHLMHDEGRLIAQRDAVPGNGLFPVESWEPGELVRDQFALYLPPELPAGEYELQVGIYSSTSGQRYSLVEPEGGTYVVVQRFTVEDTSQTP